MKNQAGTWDTKVETLELKVPYATFKKIASSQIANISGGAKPGIFARKDLLALRDLNSRVIATSATTK